MADRDTERFETDSDPDLKRKIWRAFVPQALSIMLAALVGVACIGLGVAYAQARIGTPGMLAGGLLLIALLILLLLYAWRACRRTAVASRPMRWLVDQVRQFDLRRTSHDEFAPASLPAFLDEETRLLASSLNGMSREVEVVLERERRFTRDASHELRTPLTVIRMASDLLLADREQSAYARRALRRIQDSGRDMEALIESFLLLARAPDLQAGGEEAHVQGLVYEQVEDARPLIADKQVELRVHAEHDFSVQAPARAVSVLIGNLVRNACVFTDLGRIDVRIGHGELVIQDTGVGMSPEFAAHAFEPFYRSGEGRHGHGIGLSIVRRLADRFGWQVTLDSEPGQGTVATVSFPEAELRESRPPSAGE